MFTVGIIVLLLEIKFAIYAILFQQLFSLLLFLKFNNHDFVFN